LRTPLARIVPSDVESPPTTSTLPSGSMTSVWYERGNAIGATSRQAGDGTVVSSTAALPCTTRFL
jgi:hypothetical protein